MLIKQQF